MTPQMVVSIGREALTVVLMVSGPMLLFGLIIGLVISIFQAITQINEMTLTFVPKILAVAVHSLETDEQRRSDLLAAVAFGD